ncbi:MAG: SPASM domain-containing protein [Thermoproteota archaeon]
MNYNEIPSFLDYLVSIGLRDKIKLGIGIPRGVFPYCTITQFSEKETSKRVFKIWKMAIEKGFGFHIEPGVQICSAIRENSQLIDPTGRIYKCWALVGKEEFAVGNIDEEYKPTFYEFVMRIQQTLQRCRGCSILPFCNGGCLI